MAASAEGGGGGEGSGPQPPQPPLQPLVPGLAEESGLIKVGDVIVGVNGVCGRAGPPHAPLHAGTHATLPFLSASPSRAASFGPVAGLDRDVLMRLIAIARSITLGGLVVLAL